MLSTKLVNRFEQDLVQSQKRWDSLREESPAVWSYWDFVYFSTVTQTTVGYGDIVPNSTSVRALVCRTTRNRNRIARGWSESGSKEQGRA